MQIRKSTSVNVILYKSKTLANGEHPLMLRITKNGKRKYLSLGISCDEKRWNFAKSKPTDKHPDKVFIESIVSKKIAEYTSEIAKLKEEGKEHTSDSLIEKVEKNQRKITVFDYYREIIKNLIESKKIGNSKIYTHNLSVLKRFRKNKDLSFTDIDFRLLNQLAGYLRQIDFMETSMSLFFRTLRAIYNKAIKEGIVRKDNYPFDTFKISEFSTETRKRALTKAEIKKIESLDLKPGTNLYESRLYFIFSYYGQGINFNDIAKLRYVDMKDYRIEYKRTKTGQIINFKLVPAAQEIIDYFGKVTAHDYNNYIFPILNINVHKTPVQIDNRIHKVITKVNADLKEIGNIAGIQIPITTYVARHTFANVLKKSGVASNVISEAMGHDNPETTQIYLDSFGNDEIDKAMENL